LPLSRSLIRKRSLRWWFLKRYLDGRGYSVYPTEINCSGAHCPDPERNLIVDVAAFIEGRLYAFEYKSSGDQLIRAIPQIKNYAINFDRVVVVAEVPRHDASLNLNRGVRIKSLLSLGAGLWTVQFPNNPYSPEAPPQIIELVAPKQQNPHPENRTLIMNKFQRYVWGLPVPEHPNQKQIEEWIKKRDT